MFNQLAEKLSVHRPSDWANVTPEQVLSQDRTGPKTLANIRSYLAKRNLTLAGDRTPEFWLSETSEKAISPFTILIDTKEQHPFAFADITTGPADGFRQIVAQTIRCDLGISRGDYSLRSYEGEIHIERKSMEDAHGTILGWGDRRDRFVATLGYLSQIDFGCVVVECSLGALLANAPERGKKTKLENRRLLNSTYLSWIMQFPSVPWLFCDSRKLAEAETYRIFEKFFQRKIKNRKRANSKQTSLI